MPIVRLENMNDVQRKNYMEGYNGMLIGSGNPQAFMMRPDERFDDNGLRFSVDYLSSIGKAVIMLPLELMAEYVDLVTKTKIDDNDEEFIYHQVIDPVFDIETMYEGLNASSIGNMAYVCLHCKSSRAKQVAEDILNKIFVKYKGKLLQQINDAL